MGHVIPVLPDQRGSERPRFPNERQTKNTFKKKTAPFENRLIIPQISRCAVRSRPSRSTLLTKQFEE